MLPLLFKNSDFGAEESFLIPVAAAYGDSPVFRHSAHSLDGFDWELVFSELERSVIRSAAHKIVNSEEPRRSALIKQPGKIFILLRRTFIDVIAPDMDSAEKASQAFLARYAKKQNPPKPCYHLIARKYGIETMEVDLDLACLPGQSDLDLLYGEGFSEWMAGLEALMAGSKGLSIFQGGPGTGKTSFIRLLASRLSATHRFYFIPPLFASTITDPDFIKFWERQRIRHADRQFVCLFEDAEGCLMVRGPDNRERVEAILNFTDGLMSDFLRIQVICTINCGMPEIDPALLRPGRLIATREFGRVPRTRALRIAAKFGLELGDVADDYSLAEIFNGSAGNRQLAPSAIGFGQA